KRGAVSFQRELGRLMWDNVGMARSEHSLKVALSKVPAVREEFWNNVSVPGGGDGMNVGLEQASRVSDFLEFAELMAHDALERDESCGAHFREEHQYPDGEAKRDDERFSHVAAWEFIGVGSKPIRHVEPLEWAEV